MIHSLLENVPSFLGLSQTCKRDHANYETNRYHNTTSYFKRCIDGYFFNHNEQALKELQNIIQVADRGMSLLQTEIDRAREEHRDTTTASGSTTTAGTMTGAGPTMMMAANGLANGHIMPNIPTPDEGATIDPSLLSLS